MPVLVGDSLRLHVAQRHRHADRGIPVSPPHRPFDADLRRRVCAPHEKQQGGEERRFSNPSRIQEPFSQTVSSHSTATRRRNIYRLPAGVISSRQFLKTARLTILTEAARTILTKTTSQARRKVSCQGTANLATHADVLSLLHTSVAAPNRTTVSLPRPAQSNSRSFAQPRAAARASTPDATRCDVSDSARFPPRLGRNFGKGRPSAGRWQTQVGSVAEDKASCNCRCRSVTLPGGAARGFWGAKFFRARTSSPRGE